MPEEALTTSCTGPDRLGPADDAYPLLLEGIALKSLLRTKVRRAGDRRTSSTRTGADRG
ncbi:hypothetical protein JOF29_000706 [Kribbella aluminosa]|uniref:Uncharacterized protein n=1 Tax=Kribbella aluminosa TaxID=416017 RepID=A0ABS4UDC9_9ACTN|nr:hypothetical protein [Kribbella aluminosa]MBP2349623.1 hypothetical protein [Kribbella aluminosa]